MNSTFHDELVRLLDEFKAANDALPPEPEYGKPGYTNWEAQCHLSLVGYFDAIMTLVMDNYPNPTATAEQNDEYFRLCDLTAPEREAIIRSATPDCLPTVFSTLVSMVLLKDHHPCLHVAKSPAFPRIYSVIGPFITKLLR